MKIKPFLFVQILANWILKTKKYLWFHAFLVACHCQNVCVFSKMGSKINSSDNKHLIINLV
jgi:hypothetical protein